MKDAAITPQDYAAFCSFLQENCGIVLGDNKHYLVTSRLTKLMSDSGIDSFSILMSRLRSDNRLRILIVDAMTTNETSWFRDNYPFEALKEKIFPEFSAAKLKEVRIWSAACSTGQEAYSISMVASEFASTRPSWLSANGLQIVATDISGSVLEQAKRGEYEPSIMARGLTPERRSRFFKQKENSWVLNDDIRRRVSFRELNLMQPYTSLGKFDIIFCRNVLIYFSGDLKKDILSRLSKALRPHGYLVLGGSESISNYSESFDLVRWQSGVLYQLKG